eukprot:3143850-Amphidinium_carterae.1
MKEAEFSGQEVPMDHNVNSYDKTQKRMDAQHSVAEHTWMEASTKEKNPQASKRHQLRLHIRKRDAAENDTEAKET